MIIAIDIDNVCINTTQAVLKAYNKDAEDNLELKDITEYGMENFVKPAYRKTFYQYFLSREMWKSAEVIPDCQKYIAKLFNEGHTILFVTSTEPENLRKKASWLKRTFPYINVRKALFSCPVKQYMNVDILIDDYTGNIGSLYRTILLDYPWNSDYNTDNKRTFRAQNWKEIYDFINEMDFTKEFNYKWS